MTGEFCAVGKKLQNTWLENFGGIGKKTCRTRDWEILVLSEKKGIAAHVAGKFVPSEKKNCRTPREWKILVRSEKTTAEHVAGKCWCGRKKRTRGWKSTLAFEKNICAPQNQIGNFCIMSTNSRRNYCNGMCSQMASKHAIWNQLIANIFVHRPKFHWAVTGFEKITSFTQKVILPCKAPCTK